MPSQIGRCKPRDRDSARHGEILFELRKRRKANLEKTQQKEKKDFDKAKALTDSNKSAALEASVREGGSNGEGHFGRPSVKQVNEQVMRVIARNGLKLELVDNEEFRKMANMMARAGPAYLSAHHDQGVNMPKRKAFTEVILLELDAKLQTDMIKRVKPIMIQTGGTMMGDGTTAVDKTPVLSTLLGTVAGDLLLEIKDTSGIEKNMQYIAATTVTQIRAMGPANITACTFDGACRGAFVEINKEPDCKHVFCFIDPAHSMDGFLKAVGSDKDLVTIASCQYKGLDEKVSPPPPYGTSISLRGTPITPRSKYLLP
jgi:hypothetical protein